MNWELIINSIVTIILALITGYIIPWLRAKLGSENLEKLEKWTRIAVESAEMIYRESGKGKFKKEYVLSFLSELLAKANIEISDAELNNIIESAVLELKLKESFSD